MTPEELDRAHKIAKEHHAVYVRLAPNFDYTVSNPSWEDMPENKKSLLVATVAELLDRGIINDRIESR